MSIVQNANEVDGAATEEFLASSEGLRTVLTVLDQLGPDGWHTLPVAKVLLELAQKRFAPVAQAWHRPPEDATYAAFLAMRGRSARTARDPWGVVTRAVELAMQAETYGERLLISPERARRPVHRPAEAPMRAGEHEEFLYDIVATEGSVAGRSDDGVERLIATCAAFLVVAGWPHARARRVVEYVSMRAADMGSRESALDALRRDNVTRLHLGLSHSAWNTLVGLLIGAKPRVGSTATLGVFARVLLGDQLGDLLRDTDLLDQAQLTCPGGSHD
ncbi:hypothetical protein EF847_10070 [Actinobacteria bacterium YIM 96077]|uniref:Serine/arginine repetitive matrix protein 2 n=1 Tax=Phytoactinopolyspora halophila TaxID=1981511 RepID=A0A329QLN6_9ACTN|nr:hypothetical protein [Phytoactinopolyspora halophila]AYY12996.1 hypothetical protein EF847_10070 [Actinobacteria bacterium YIM 96077]RAW13260.1 hypothetical protein DPM12_13095 [Phytoactinopolyspora halophila]